MSKLFSFIGLILLYKSQHVSFTYFVYIVSTNSLLTNIAIFGNIFSGILIGIIVTYISFLLIKSRISANKLTDISAIMLSITAMMIIIIFIFGISTFISTQSIENLLYTRGQVSKITYPLFPVFFFTSITLLIAGYIKERLKTNSVKSLAIIVPSLIFLIIILVNIIKLFY